MTAPSSTPPTTPAATSVPASSTKSTTTALLPRSPGSTAGARGARMIVVGGVPGAGKSTLLARVADEVPDATVLDPDLFRARIAAWLPHRVPYGAYRWLPHALHGVATVVTVLRGPRGGAPLLVHDTATRERRLLLLGLLAWARGWDPLLVAVDVSLADALDGQVDRGRVVQPEEFVRHWERWSAQRSVLAAVAGGRRGPWSAVFVMPRGEAFARVRELARWRPAVVPDDGRATDRPAPGVPCVA